MNIRIGKYNITSDSLNVILSEEKIIKDEESKNLGKVYQENIGYYGKLEHCLEALLNKEINEAEAENIEGLMQKIEFAKKEIIQSIA